MQFDGLFVSRGMLVFWALLAGSPGPATLQPQATVPKAGAKAPAPKFKAIWEPVPFSRDVELNAIQCAGANECWAAGDKSTILHTSDGGTTWEVQLGGDSDSLDDPIKYLHVLDGRHSWVMTSRGKILATADGKSWSERHTASGTAKGVWFMSPAQGVLLDNADSTSQTTLRITADGGKSWEPVSRCALEANIEGLARRLACMWLTAQFVAPGMLFAAGSAAAGDYLGVFGKSADSGVSWSLALLPDVRRRITSLHFWSQTHGIAVADRGEEIHWTEDGGRTWTRSARQRLWPSAYASGEGKIIVGAGENGGICYSFDGGRSFSSRPFRLPARVRAIAFPDSTHGYLVGEHGMAYRYRVVPIEYTARGMLPAMAP